MACREEEIPQVGDTLVYDIVDASLLIVRTAPDEIRAFHNSCLHRGTQLRAGPGHVAELRCPFHGFTWNLDGSFREMPCSWDFPHVEVPSASVGFRTIDAALASARRCAAAAATPAACEFPPHLPAPVTR